MSEAMSANTVVSAGSERTANATASDVAVCAWCACDGTPLSLLVEPPIAYALLQSPVPVAHKLTVPASVATSP